MKITAASLLVLSSGVAAQELEWIRRMPDVVSFANEFYPSDYAGYGYNVRANKIVVYTRNFLGHPQHRNIFYYDGESFAIANLFENYNSSQKYNILETIGPNTQIIYDTARDTLNFSGNSRFTTYDGGNWQLRLHETLLPYPYAIDAPSDDFSGNKFTRYVFDNNRNVIICIVWSESSQIIAEYDGIRWQVKSPSPQFLGTNFNAVYDSERRKTVIFGGKYQIDHNRLYEWDGNVVVERETTNPPSRFDHLMTYDKSIKKTVLFGGRHIYHQNGATETLLDTWTFDGTQWIQNNTQFTGSFADNTNSTWYELRPASFNLVYDPVKNIHVLLGPSYNPNRTIVFLERCELVPTCNQPVITHQPVDQFVPTGAVVTFFAQGNNGTVCNDGIIYQWQRRNPNVEDENSPVAWYNLQDDGIFSNTTTSTLTVQSPTPAVATGYRCVVTNGCPCYDGSYRSVTSNIVNFVVSCPSDFNADGGVDFSDVEAFFERWENGC